MRIGNIHRAVYSAQPSRRSHVGTLPLSLVGLLDRKHAEAKIFCCFLCRGHDLLRGGAGGELGSSKKDLASLTLDLRPPTTGSSCHAVQGAGSVPMWRTDGWSTITKQKCLHGPEGSTTPVIYKALHDVKDSFIAIRLQG